MDEDLEKAIAATAKKYDLPREEILGLWSLSFPKLVERAAELLSKSLPAFALLFALSLVSLGASCSGTPRDQAGRVIVTAETALSIATEAELSMRCGQPTAIVGKCIEPALHAQLKERLLQGFDLVKKAQGIYAALPPTGTPSIASISSIIAQVGAIIQEVMRGFPDVTAQVALAKAPAVQKTLEVK